MVDRPAGEDNAAEGAPVTPAAPPGGAPAAPGAQPPYPGVPPSGPAPGAPPYPGPAPAYGAPPPYPGPAPAYGAPPPYPGPAPVYGEPAPYGGPAPGGWGAPSGAPPPGYPTSPYPSYGVAPPFGVGPPPLANWGTRMGGWLLDWIILFAVGLVVNGIFNSINLGRITFHVTNTTTNQITIYHFSVLAPILQIAIVILYGGLLCGSARGQTIGMMAVKVRAIDAEAGGPIGAWRGLGRAAFEYFLFIVFIIPWVIDMLFPLWDSRCQTLHDKVTNTVVVKLNPGAVVR